RRRRHPAQPASAHGRLGPLPARGRARGAARRRAGAARGACRLRADAILFLRPADVADRAHQRYGGRFPVGFPPPPPPPPPPAPVCPRSRPHPAARALGPRPHAATVAGTRGRAMTFALAVVPIALLLLGFPIFLVLLTAVTIALVFFMHVPLAALQQTLFAS